VLEGEAGIGKTTLWRSGIAMAKRAELRLLEARPVEPESSLAFAALGDLLGEALDDVLPTLPAPQRRSLEVALLLSEDDGPAPDRRAVAVGVLGALRAIGAFGPVVLAIDDLHWLDAPSAGALEFALRRLRDEPIGVLAANRIPERPALDLFRAFDVARVQRVEVKAMSLEAIGRLVRHRLDLVLPRPMLRRIHETSDGNPLFALEIARALQQGHLELDSEEPLPIPADLEALLRDRVLRLPDATRSALLICSAASRPTVELVGEASGSSDDPLGPAKEAGIVVVDRDRVAFSHPLLALAVYRSASTGERRAAHRRLAEVTQDLEERARHLALASSGPDRALAELLDGAAGRAFDRGAPGSAAELADLARHSTPGADLESQLRRGMEAAEFRFEAGDAAGARALAQELRSAAPPGPVRGQISHLIASLSWNDVNEIRGLLESAIADTSEEAPLAAIHADVGYVEILGGDLRVGSEHGRRAIELAERADAPALLMDALLCTAHAEFMLGLDTAALLSRAAAVERRIVGRPPFSSLLSNVGTMLGMRLMWSGDLVGGRRTLERTYRDLVDRGHYTILWETLVFLSELESRAGAFGRALEYAEELVEITVEAGYDQTREVGLWARALAETHLGLVEPARRDATEGLALAERHGDLYHVIRNRSVLGFLELSLGDLEASSRSMERLPELLASRGIVEPGVYPFVPDYVEALVGLRQLGRAEEALEPLERWGVELDRPLALATSARCRGLTASVEDPVTSLDHLERAIELHDRVGQPFELARTQLVLGAVQRRARQKRNARDSLESALATFDELGTPLWAGKARAELARIGGRAPAGDGLTPSERRIAELVAEGKTNKEVAAALVVAERTVESALTQIYRKLDVRSRTQLSRKLDDSR
jgi:DNA-binding CsgD family transcriptional regulator/tetratricopeptide (TPR) repeat protein